MVFTPKMGGQNLKTNLVWLNLEPLKKTKKIYI
jgi:hypothetical protein